MEDANIFEANQESLPEAGFHLLSSNPYAEQTAAALRELADYVANGWLVRISGETLYDRRERRVTFQVDVPHRLLRETDFRLPEGQEP